MISGVSPPIVDCYRPATSAAWAVVPLASVTSHVSPTLRSTNGLQFSWPAFGHWSSVAHNLPSFIAHSVKVDQLLRCFGETLGRSTFVHFPVALSR